MKKMILGLSIIGLLIMPVISGNALTSDANALELPSWVENSKVKSDFRFRYQTEEKETSSGKEYDRDRLRIRLRVGVESAPNDQWTLGFGLATGKDANSGNQTLGGDFESKDFYLDYAFAAYQPIKPVELTLGKFKNPIWGPKDLLWDSDINPEGLAAKLKFEAAEGVSLFLTPVYYIFNEVDYNDEVSDPTADPNLFAIQVGIDAKLGEVASVEFAGTYYQFNDIVDGIDQFDADAWALDGEVGFDALPVYAAIFGQYSSFDADGMDGNDDAAYLIGLKFGDKKVKKAGDWEVKYNYRKLEANSWAYTALGDSDFLGGNKAGKGSELEAVVGIAKNVSLGLDYYTAEKDGSSDSKDVIQFDVNVKFP